MTITGDLQKSKSVVKDKAVVTNKKRKRGCKNAIKRKRKGRVILGDVLQGTDGSAAIKMKQTAYQLLLQSQDRLQQQMKNIFEDVSAGRLKGEAGVTAREEVVNKLSLIVDALKVWPSVHLQGAGLTAQLSVPDDRRLPLLITDVQKLLCTFCLPNFTHPTRTWFRGNTRRVNQIIVVIVEGISLDTFSQLKLSRNKVKRYHEAMLKDGRIAHYSGLSIGNDSHGHAARQECRLQQPKKVSTAADACAKSSPDSSTGCNNTNNRKKKKLKTSPANGNACSHSDNDIDFKEGDDALAATTSKEMDVGEPEDNLCSTVHTWLPQTCSLLAICQELVAPARYDSCVADHLLQLRLSHQKRIAIRNGSQVPPKTLKKQIPVEDLYDNSTQACKIKAASTAPSSPTPSLPESGEGDNTALPPYEQIQNFFNITKDALDEANSNFWRISSKKQRNIPKDKFDRRMLLMTFEELCVESYPIPQDVYEEHASHYMRPEKIKPVYYSSFVATKETYTKVTDSSPLFGVDCEFVFVTGNRSALGSISIVNESGKAVYHTLVKPSEHVVNYATKWSGLTRESLESVTTTLEDVQQHIRRHLPPDAILVGHSLNFDLRVMEMHHPYVIDTSLIYSMSGFKHCRSKLKTLASHFLDRQIQTSDSLGHDATEDATATLQLAQLKLQHDPTFGVVTHPDSGSLQPSFRNTEGDLYYNLFEYLEDWRSMVKTSKQPPKSYSLLTTAQHVADWADCGFDLLQRPIRPRVLEDNAAVMRAACQQAMESDIQIVHLQADPRLSSAKVKPRLAALAALDAQLAELHGACANKALFCVIFGGTARDAAVHSNGLLMCGVVGRELMAEQPESGDEQASSSSPTELSNDDLDSGDDELL